MQFVGECHFRSCGLPSRVRWSTKSNCKPLIHLFSSLHFHSLYISYFEKKAFTFFHIDIIILYEADNRNNNYVGLSGTLLFLQYFSTVNQIPRGPRERELGWGWGGTSPTWHRAVENKDCRRAAVGGVGGRCRGNTHPSDKSVRAGTGFA